MNEIQNATIHAPASFTFKNKKLNEISVSIAAIGADMGKKNVELAKLLGTVKRDELFKDDGFKSVAEYADSTFGIAKSLAYQLAKVGERFYLSESETAKKAAAMLPASNLAEITNMTDEQVKAAMDSGEISATSTQKKLRDVAAGVKHAKPKVLEDYEIDVRIIRTGGEIDTVHYDKSQLPTVLDDMASRNVKLGEYIDKVFIREGKYDGIYHKGMRIVVCEDDTVLQIVYGIVSKPKPEKKPSKKSLDDMTDEEIMEMLAARKAAREAEKTKK